MLTLNLKVLGKWCRGVVGGGGGGEDKLMTLVVECQTHDKKVVSLIPSGSDGRIVFSGVHCLC